MTAVWIALGILGGGALLCLLVCLICYFRVFYLPKTPPSDVMTLPDGDNYEAFREQMETWVREIRAMPHRYVYVTSRDGLRLRGAFYEYGEDAPVEILFHGYRGSAERDLSGGVERCFALGHSALIVDQRGSSGSEGHTATFGILESRDCECWVRFVTEELCPGRPVILTGISMGAATVMLCAERELPSAVVGVLADCGYTSARAIIGKVVRDMHLPAKLLYPFIRLSARLFGGFDPDERSPIEAMRNSRLPVIFFHGDTDAFVPCYMSEENHAACIAEKRLVIIPGAGHGLCYPVDKQRYIDALRDFFDPIVARYKDENVNNCV